MINDHNFDLSLRSSFHDPAWALAKQIKPSDQDWMSKANHISEEDPVEALAGFSISTRIVN